MNCVGVRLLSSGVGRLEGGVLSGVVVVFCGLV